VREDQRALTLWNVSQHYAKVSLEATFR